MANGPWLVKARPHQRLTALWFQRMASIKDLLGAVCLTGQAVRETSSAIINNVESELPDINFHAFRPALMSINHETQL